MSKNVPLIKTGQAILSLRDSGYTIEAALGEVIDNAIEANANTISIELFEGVNKKKKKCVSKIAIVDDGDGMNKELLQNYPQIGFSTRYMSTTTIGKYGVGAKLAAINYAKKFEVWSKTRNDKEWLYVYFDLEEFENNSNVDIINIPEPKKKAIPKELEKLIPSDSGTIILWSKVDRLEEGRYAVDFNELRLSVEKEISRIFRYYLEGGIKIVINENQILPYDPLMQMQRSYSDKMIALHYKNLAKKEERYKEYIQDHYSSIEIAKKSFKISDSEFDVTITVYPREVTRVRGKGGDNFAKKLRIPENQGQISFVRLKREVSYTNVPKIFPRGVGEPDRFIGIEVSFNPDLDEFFGVRNVKRGVEPHGKLREMIREFLHTFLPNARKVIDDAWGKASRKEKTNINEHDEILSAVKKVNTTLAKGKVKRESEKDEQLLLDLASDVVGDDKDKQQAYLDKIKNFPFVMVSDSFPGNQFIDVQYLSDQTIIRINTRHRFYRDMWEPLKNLSSKDSGSISGMEAKDISRRAIEALSLLIIAYGKAGSLNPTAYSDYSELTNQWGTYLDLFLKNIKDVQ
jgi:hypothetical protein